MCILADFFNIIDQSSLERWFYFFFYFFFLLDFAFRSPIFFFYLMKIAHDRRPTMTPTKKFSRRASIITFEKVFVFFVLFLSSYYFIFVGSYEQEAKARKAQISMKSMRSVLAKNTLEYPWENEDSLLMFLSYIQCCRCFHGCSCFCLFAVNFTTCRSRVQQNNNRLSFVFGGGGEAFHALKAWRTLLRKC